MKYLCDYCEKFPCTDDEYKMRFRCPTFSPKPNFMTNADCIRAMSDEELAEKWLDLVACTDCPVDKSKCDMVWNKCSKAALDWLKSPAEVDNG